MPRVLFKSTRLNFSHVQNVEKGRTVARRSGRMAMMRLQPAQLYAVVWTPSQLHAPPQYLFHRAMDLSDFRVSFVVFPAFLSDLSENLLFPPSISRPQHPPPHTHTQTHRPLPPPWCCPSDKLFCLSFVQLSHHPQLLLQFVTPALAI